MTTVRMTDEILTDGIFVKHWSFATCAIAGFACSGFAVLLLIVNALASNAFVQVALPVAIIALVAGGALSVRAQILRYRERSTSRR